MAITANLVAAAGETAANEAVATGRGVRAVVGVWADTATKLASEYAHAREVLTEACDKTVCEWRRWRMR